MTTPTRVASGSARSEIIVYHPLLNLPVRDRAALRRRRERGVQSYSGCRALRNADIKKKWGQFRKKKLRNRGVPLRGPKKPATYTHGH